MVMYILSRLFVNKYMNGLVDNKCYMQYTIRIFTKSYAIHCEIFRNHRKRKLQADSIRTYSSPHFSF